jgi:hypothetical protein
MKCETICGGSPGAGGGPLFVAGEVSFGDMTGAAFAFAQVASEQHPVTVGTLDAENSNLFTNPSPGTLQYVGTAPLRFRVSYALSAVWLSATGGVTASLFLSNLILNSDNVLSTLQLMSLDIGAEGDIAFTGSSDTLLTLQPGDTLQIGLAAFTPGSTYSMLVSGLSIVATRS